MKTLLPQEIEMWYLIPALRRELTKIMVKDYYTLNWIDGTNAFYVIGSDILGPMGNELIPFDSREAATEFKKDHTGKNILEFKEIDLQLIKFLAQNMEMQ